MQVTIIRKKNCLFHNYKTVSLFCYFVGYPRKKNEWVINKHEKERENTNTWMLGNCGPLYINMGLGWDS